MKTTNRSFYVSILTGVCLAVVSPVMGQNSGTALFTDITITGLGANSLAGTMNGATLMPHFFNDAPASIGTYGNSYPGSVSLSEANVQNATGNGLERDIWYFSNNGGASPYNFQTGDYFSASFNLTLTGGIAGKDLEGGFIFSNPSGAFGGDDQVVAIGQGGGNAGAVVQFGGPSYYPFSPAAGGYPGVGGSVPNYVIGQTINMTFIYTIDPVTTMNAFEYAVNGQFAASAPGNNYFDLGGPVGSPGDFLGGYFQLAPTQVPEPAMVALLGLGLLPLARLLRRRA
jgi:hypothetical protein